MEKKGDVFWRRVKILIACWGVFVAIGIIISVFLVVTGMDDKFDIVLKYYFSIGVVVVLLVCWPFFSKHMK